MSRNVSHREPVIEAIEQRTHFSVSLGSVPLNIGDLSGTRLSKTLVHANSSGLPDEFTFTVAQPEQLNLSTGPSPQATITLRLENANGDIAFTHPRTIKGVVGADSTNCLQQCLPARRMN